MIQDLVTKAQAAYQEGRYGQAAEGFQAASTGYQARGDELLAAEMDNNRSVALLQAGEPQAALDAIGNTEALFREAGELGKQAMAVGNRAAAFEALKRLDQAEAEYQRSAKLLDAAGETEMRAHVLKSLAALQVRRGKQTDALLNMQAGLKGKKKPSLRERLLSKLLELPFKLGR